MVREFELTDTASKGVLYALSKREKPVPLISIQIEVSENGTASTKAAYSRIDKLIALGLVKEKREGRRTERPIYLTEKGKNDAENLKKSMNW